MSHHIYHTSGLVIATKQRGEADLLVKIFTREFGMILAVAQGARKMESKSRFALAQYSIPEIDIIKTKESFRIGAARPEAWPPNKNQLLVRAKVSALLARFVVSDEPNDQLYENVISLIQKENKNIDIIAMVTILIQLGYWSIEEGDTEFLETGEIGTEQKKEIISRIHQATSQIHL